MNQDDQEKDDTFRPKKKKKIVIWVILAVLLLVFGAVCGGFYYMSAGLTVMDLPEDNDSLGISESDETEDDIVNIALFGIDTREDDNSGRSDAIMILTIDRSAGKIIMTSILRDSKVPVEGYGDMKINAAYVYGGPALAIKTINQNFALDIKEYVTVNFNQLAEIVDAVGGVTLTLTSEEVAAVNTSLAMEAIDGSGEMLLNGKEAVAFSRIRKIDSDIARADRQQQVLNAILSQLESMPKTEYPGFIRQFLSTVETSLDYSDLIGLSMIMLARDLTISKNIVPSAEYEQPWGGIADDGAWYWIYDLDAAAERIHTIIYGSETGE